MPTVLSRALAALPDALTSSLFLIAWVAPGFLGHAGQGPHVDDADRIHRHAFERFLRRHRGMTDASRGKRLMLITALSAFYLLFVVGFSVGFASTWPIWAFGWLFVSRFAHLWTKGGGNDDAIRRNMSSWMISAMAYLGGVFATILLPLPALGLTPSAIAELHIPNNMSGLWIDKPWTVIAFGALYFAVLAWSKYRLSATQTIA